MNERRQQLGYLPIGYKLMLTYMLFIIIPVSVIGFVSHSMYEDSIRKHTRTNIQGTLLQIRDNIEYRMQEITRISSLLYGDFDFYQYLRNYEEGWENYDRMINAIFPKFQAVTESTGMKFWMSVFLKNESIYERYRYTFNNENPDFSVSSFDIYHMSRIKERLWYTAYPEEKYGETMKWWQIEQDAENNRISLLRRLIDTYNPVRLNEVGFLRINVGIQELFESMNYSKIGNGSVLFIKDEYGRKLYQSGELPSNVTDDQQLHENYLTITETVGKQSWQLVALVPITIIEQDSFKVRMFIITMCLLCFIVFSFVGIFISRFFAIRINKFVSVLNAMREGDLHKRISYRGKDEFSQIATALNDMGENIESLIKEVYLTQLQKKEAELEMLQSQINPHFLYNALSSIHRLAKFGDMDKLQQMVFGLAKFYRLTLNDGRTMIPVPSEIEQAEAYLQISTIKYGDRMSVMFDIDANVWPYETIKLILQPFIENVLKHAWCGDRIHIRIVGVLEGDDILFRVIDDGIGMKQERIDHIFDPQEHVNTGYGVRNVDQRIKLQYGEEYGVSIFSTVGVGTAVQIRIPARKCKRKHTAKP